MNKKQGGQISRRKLRIRKTMQEKRGRQSNIERMTNSLKIWKGMKGLPEFRKAGSVMFYLALPDEVETEQMMRESARTGKNLIVPFVDKEAGKMVASWLKDYDTELETGLFGVPEPKVKYRRIVEHKDIDLVIVPGIAFDLRGARLGFGAGYYDRFLKGLREDIPSVAIAFDFQISGKLPAASHDMLMDKIVTERRIVDCRKYRRRSHLA